MSPKDAERWRAARTLAGLGELTARWLEGKIESIPTVWPGCGPDEQTTDLIPVLAACNRVGYGTTVSQPGEEPAPGYDGRLGTQRAAVQGFASADAAAAHRACTAATPLIVLVTGPAHDMERRQEIRIPVTLAGDQETRGSAAISTAVTSKTIRPDTASAAPAPSTRWVLPGRSPSSSTRSGAATTCSGRPWSRSRGGHQVLPGLVPATAAADRGLCRRARHQLIAVRPLGVAGEPSVRRLVMSSRTSP
jgi:hypothetical protein